MDDENDDIDAIIDDKVPRFDLDEEFRNDGDVIVSCG